jgi:hypothetical protein
MVHITTNCSFIAGLLAGVAVRPKPNTQVFQPKLLARKPFSEIHEDKKLLCSVAFLRVTLCSLWFELLRA